MLALQSERVFFSTKCLVKVCEVEYVPAGSKRNMAIHLGRHCVEAIKKLDIPNWSALQKWRRPFRIICVEMDSPGFDAPDSPVGAVISTERRP